VKEKPKHTTTGDGQITSVLQKSEHVNTSEIKFKFSLKYIIFIFILCLLIIKQVNVM